MANTETENLFNSILDQVKAGTANVETLEETKGTDARNKESVIAGKWKIGDLIFAYTIPEGKKYGKATVEQENSDVAVDTFGIDKTLMCIVYFLRNPKPQRKTKAKEKCEVKKADKPAKAEKKTKKAPAKEAAKVDSVTPDSDAKESTEAEVTEKE